MNRFTKRAVEFSEKKRNPNWFECLPLKIQKEIQDAIKQHKGAMSDLGMAIKSELKIPTSVQHICAVLRELK
jgi:hypothetical protein